jgi:hypothetical protein
MLSSKASWAIASLAAGAFLGSRTSRRPISNADVDAGGHATSKGIMAGVTTAGVMSALYSATHIGPQNAYAAPLMGVAGLLGGYIVSRNLSNYRDASTLTGNTKLADIPTYLKVAGGLGALYFGGRGAMPYTARIMERFGRMSQPFGKALDKAAEEAEWGSPLALASTLTGGLRDVESKFALSANNLTRFPISNSIEALSQLNYHVNIPGDARKRVANDIIGSIQAQYSKPNMEIINGLRSATLLDLSRTTSPISDKLYGLVQEGVKLGNIGLGKGVFYDTRSKRILNLSQYSLSNIFWKSVLKFEKSIKLPFVGFNPITFFRPTEFSDIRKQYNKLHFFKPNTPYGPAPADKLGIKGGIYFGGKLYDGATGDTLTKGGMVIKTGSWLTEKGQQPFFKETTWGSILRMRYSAGMNREAPKGYVSVGNAFIKQPKGKLEKFKDWFELGSRYNEHPSVWSSIWTAIKEKRGQKGLWKSVKEAWESAFDATNIQQTTKNKYRLNQSMSAFGSKNFNPKKGRSSFAFMPFSDTPGTGAFWMANRFVALNEAIGLGGLNPRTTKSASDVIWKMIFKRYLPAFLAFELLKGTNDVSNMLIGTGPKEIAATAIAGGLTGASWMRDALGITGMAQYFEELMPGSMTSPASTLGRSIGMPLVAGVKLGPQGLMAGAAVSAFLGGPTDITKTFEETKGEYFGDKNVPIRSGRWWGFGGSSFWGGRIQTFVPNWYQRLMSRYQYGDVMYGSELEYWTNYGDPYHWAQKHYRDRPYPIVTSPVEEVPFIGPSLAGWFSRPLVMHPGEWGGGSGAMLGNGPSNGMGQGIGGGPGGLGSAGGSGGSYGGGLPLGGGGNSIEETIYPGLGGQYPELGTPGSLQNRIGEQFYRGTEYAGIYGFATNTILKQVIGEETPFVGPRLESALRISSAERSYWDIALGGLGGQTELFRRFLPHRRRENELINEIPNTMPPWLPGANYFKNFRQGDPYSSIPFGEIRLPGSGYEQFHGSEYGPLDKYRILADVAPYSSEFKFQAEQIMAMSKAGMLTPEEEEMRQEIRKQVSAKKKRYEFEERNFGADNTTTETVTVNKYLGEGRFTVANEPGYFKLAGLSAIDDKQAGLESILYQGARVEITRLENDETKWNSVVPTTPVIIEGLNRQLLESGVAKYKRTGPGATFDVLNMQVKYNPIEQAAGSAWETFSHMDTPFHTKFLNERTPLESWERTQVYGRESVSWSNLPRDLIDPWVQKMKSRDIFTATATGAIGAGMFGGTSGMRMMLGAAGALGGANLSVMGAVQSDKGAYVPKYRKKEWDIEQYFDALEYLKYRGMYEYARERAIEEEGIDPEKLVGGVEFSQKTRRDIARKLKKRYSKLTLQSLGNPDDLSIKDLRTEVRDQIQALQGQKYTEDEVMRLAQGGFTGAAMALRRKWQSTMYGADPNGDMGNIMRALPSKQRDYFTGLMNAPAKDREKILSITPLGMRRFLEAKWGMDVEENPDLEDYFSDKALPRQNWVGWHPAVNLDDVKLKTVKQEALDMHDFNLWESDERKLKYKPYVPYINPFDTSANRGSPATVIRNLLAGQGYSRYSVEAMDAAVLSYKGDPGLSISFEVKHETEPEATEYVRAHLPEMIRNGYIR